MFTGEGLPRCGGLETVSAVAKHFGGPSSLEKFSRQDRDGDTDRENAF